MLDFYQIKDRHQLKHIDAAVGSFDVCDWCGEDWPCDASILVPIVDWSYRYFDDWTDDPQDRRALGMLLNTLDGVRNE